jgi:hypothetical protein
MGIDLNVKFTPETLRQLLIDSSLPLINNVPVGDRPGDGTTNRLIVNGQATLQPHILESLNVPPVAR